MEISGMTIRDYRQRLGLSQRDFAEALDVSQGLVSLLELGRSPVSRKLLRRLRAQTGQGDLRPSFDDFLLEGGGAAPQQESQIQVMRPMPLEAWNNRVDLQKPPAPETLGRFLLEGQPDGARAYQFNPPPATLAPDNVAAFRPAELAELVRDQIILAQFKARHVPDGLKPGIAYLGRAIVFRKTRAATYQFECAAPALPIIELTAQNVDVVMTCFFRGRYCS